ncbi:MAG TPA: methyltransferase [Nitrospira sp.]
MDHGFERCQSIRFCTAAAGFAISIGLGLLWLPPAWAQHGHDSEHIPNVTEYLDQLERPERDQDQKPGEVVAALQLKAGMSVADLGAGSGYFSRRFAEALTETGKVYVIDVEPAALKYVEESLIHLHRPYEAEFILARPDNPKIPVGSVNLIFVCNTYHHLEDRTVYFRNIQSALKSEGRVAIIDFYHDDRSGNLSFPKRHLVPRELVIEEMTAAGYRLLTEHTFLPRQYFLEFAPQYNPPPA